MSPRRLDVSIKVDQKIREQLDDGNQMFIKISDPVRGESDWQPIAAKFLRLPTNLVMNCETENPAAAIVSENNKSEAVLAAQVMPENKEENVKQRCELSGNLSMIEKIFLLDDKQNKIEHSVGLTNDKIAFDKSFSEKFIYLKLRGVDSQVKINIADLKNPSLMQTPR